MEPTADAALRTLVAAGYRLAVVSNNDGRLHQQLTTAGLADYFTAVIDSAVVGIAKPDAAIFHHAASLLGARPDDCVMIGDDPHFDIDAAQHAGIHRTILIDHDRNRPASWPTDAFATIGEAAAAMADTAA